MITTHSRAAILESARSLLFVPGNRTDRFAKAVASGADVIIIDLEDSVGPERKSEARSAVQEWLCHHPETVVRINSPGTAWYDADVAAFQDGPRAVMMPKATPDGVADLGHRLPDGSLIIALIETAAGVLDAREIAMASGVVRLALGNVDLGAELGIDPDDHRALLGARSALVLASAAAGVALPIDGVTTSIADADVLVADVEHARSLGFTGKLCIHPNQVVPTHQTLAPSADEVRAAERILAAAGDGDATSLDGKMLDKPVTDRARQTLERASRHRDLSPSP